MLYLPRQRLDTIKDLRAALANAIALELSTIPPYLTALFSIKPGATPPREPSSAASSSRRCCMCRWPATCSTPSAAGRTSRHR
jgi:Ferritin-like